MYQNFQNLFYEEEKINPKLCYNDHLFLEIFINRSKDLIEGKSLLFLDIVIYYFFTETYFSNVILNKILKFPAIISWFTSAILTLIMTFRWIQRESKWRLK